MGPAPRPIEDRFWEKVCPEPNSGCWLWTAGGMKAGYGCFQVGGRGGRLEGAHRVSWALAHGPVPAGMLVCHKCDTPQCVNPEHLFLGTVKDNAVDMVRKGRNRNGVFPGDTNISHLRPELRQGERHGRAKLTDDGVRLIRATRAAGGDLRPLAARLGVKPAAVYKVACGSAWKHVR